MTSYIVHVVDTTRDGLIRKEFDDYAASGSTIGDKIERTHPKRGEQLHRVRLDDGWAHWRTYYYERVEAAVTS